MSQDGRNWARIEGPHHSGALFDAGQTGGPDSPFAAGPQVSWEKPSHVSRGADIRTVSRVSWAPESESPACLRSAAGPLLLSDDSLKRLAACMHQAVCACLCPARWGPHTTHPPESSLLAESGQLGVEGRGPCMLSILGASAAA